MKSPIFVVGCDRSGTSLITLTLSQSPELKMIFEAGFLPRLSSRKTDYGDFSAPRQRWYFIRDIQREKATSRTFAFEKFDNLSDQEAESALQQAAPTDYQGAAAAIYAASARKDGKDRWGEKMPEYILQVEWLASTFPNSSIVHIIRDPRDVAASIRRAGWKDSLHEAATYWKKRVSEGRAQSRSIASNRYHEVRYEKFLQNPAEVTMHLAECLDLKISTKVLSGSGRDKARCLPESHREAYPELFSKLWQPIDPSRAYAWRREMSRREIAEVESIAAPLMEELGYKVTGAQVPFSKQCREWLRDKAKIVTSKLQEMVQSI
jgi:hypothetical protein